jgi:hypothetical protein
MLQMLFMRGLQPGNTYLLGKCYSTNKDTVHLLEDDGVNICPESMQYDPYRSYDDQTNEHVQVLIDHAAEATAAGKRVTVLDSGGHVLEAINQRTEIPCDRIVGIEQTSSGFHTMKEKELRFPVLNVARSPIKLEIESPWVADTVVEKLLPRLRALPQAWQRHAKHARELSLNILAIGGGAIGAALRERFQEDMNIFDIDSTRSNIPESDFIAALSRADIVFGNTGKISLPSELHRHLKNQAVLASTSSSDREFDAFHLRQQLPPDTDCHADSPLTVQETGHSIYLLNQGFPVNFTGQSEIAPLERIQLTAALLMSGVLDAHRYAGLKGMIEYPTHAHPLIQQFVAEQADKS